MADPDIPEQVIHFKCPYCLTLFAASYPEDQKRHDEYKHHCPLPLYPTGTPVWSLSLSLCIYICVYAYVCVYMSVETIESL